MKSIDDSPGLHTLLGQTVVLKSFLGLLGAGRIRALQARLTPRDQIGRWALGHPGVVQKTSRILQR